jgi:hypothetical protein
MLNTLRVMGCAVIRQNQKNIAIYKYPFHLHICYTVANCLTVTPVLLVIIQP